MSIPLHLSPSSGFCVKSTALQPASISIRNETVQVQKGLKAFINIAWDPSVPPPPEASEESIQRALQGQGDGENNPDAWFVPVVVSDGRKDTDKAGKPALVFDCVYNSSIKNRSLAHEEFKLFLIELSLQRVEAQTSLILSRQIGTPNIRSKGKLTARTVYVSSELFARLGANLPLTATTPTTSTSEPVITPVPRKPLIEEITPEGKGKSTSSFDGKLKGILKSGSSTRGKQRAGDSLANLPLAWRWANESGQLRITIAPPNLTHDLIKSSTLDVEARRLILNIPSRSTLDINLNLSDAEIVVSVASTQHAGTASASAANLHKATEAGRDQAVMQDGANEAAKMLMLKRQRDFDVDGARAEWRVADGVLIVFA